MNNIFTVISYNIWFDDSLTAERTSSLIHIIDNTNPDVICFQEVRPNVYAFLINILNNYRYHFPKKISKGYDCAIFSKYPITKCLEHRFENSTMGRSLLITKIDYPYHEKTEDGISIDKIELVVTTTHFESLFKKKDINHTKIEQFEITSRILEQLYECFRNVLLCADTNVLRHEEHKFNEYFDDNCWLDSWKEKGSSILCEYTYDSEYNVYLQNRFPNVKYKSRIDRIMYKGDNLLLEEFSLLKGNGKIIEPSDHFGICSKFVVIKK
ncbi:endonuclease/exonuclease/phosphatase family protein [Indivirus ILV1]|uniref:Endonuclease/exonuclease/phosphatase family protein n=1 Tax=Indivirus ILV1 TaxID=1977633 RepID=A0A1V0SCT0_9VIRU|nr:endonuclease/exonuclease/phosphatase family protein [Indivirus ILV1]